MHTRRRWPVPVFAVVLVLMVAAFYHAVAQEGSVVALTPDQGLSGGIAGGMAQAGTTEEAEEFASAAEFETAPPSTATPAQAGDEEVVALATPSAWLEERTWSDGVTTVVECITVGASRSCRVNVYGPGGEFLLGREIPAVGEAFDCTGPCLDATGAVLDSSSVSRAQAAISEGDHTVGVVTAGTGTMAEGEVAVEEEAAEVQDRGE